MRLATRTASPALQAEKTAALHMFRSPKRSAAIVATIAPTITGTLASRPTPTQNASGNTRSRPEDTGAIRFSRQAKAQLRCQEIGKSDRNCSHGSPQQGGSDGD